MIRVHLKTAFAFYKKAVEVYLTHSFFFHDLVQPFQHSKNDKGRDQQQYKIHPKEIGFVLITIPHGGQYAR